MLIHRATHGWPRDVARPRDVGPVVSVEPTAEEQATMSELLHRMTELARIKNRPNPEILARTNLVQTLFNHNDFITIR